MQKTLISIGIVLLGWIGASGTAIAKPAKAPSSGTVTQSQPSGASALTGTSGIVTQPQRSGAEALTQKWQIFKGPGVELSLPESYRGGSPNTTGLQKLIGAIRSLGEDYEQIASMVEQNPSTFLLIAVDPKPSSTGGVTNVVVSAATVPATVTVDAYIDAAVKALPPLIRPVERKTVQVGQNTAGRLVTEASVASDSPQSDRLKQLIYVIKQGTTLWTVAYSTGANDYSQRLAMFERSISSFKTQSAQPLNTPSPEKKPSGSLPTATKSPKSASPVTK